ncbi:MAG: glycosyltransferase family 9 protein [Planctomycetota bacterium]
MSAIGDCILTLPVACALRDAFPDAFLGWVVEKKSAPMVRNHSALDAVIELERGWFTRPSGLIQTRSTLREFGFTVSIDPQGNTKSALAGYVAGCRHRIGFAGEHGGELSWLMNNVRVRTNPHHNHVTDRSLALLRAIGVQHDADDNGRGVRFDLPIPDAARHWATRWRAMSSGESIAVLNPGGTWPSKLWECDRFAGVARKLRNRSGLQCFVVYGGAKERAMAEQIVAQSDGAALIAPDTDLHHLAALIETADLFISGDTGPMHMSVAVGTPTIGMYGATRPGDCGPYGSPHIALQNAYESGSRRHRRNADNSAMRSIQVDDVVSAAEKILHSTKRRSAA